MDYCRTDPRRDAVRRMKGRNGLDYVEFDNAAGPTLYVISSASCRLSWRRTSRGLSDSS